MQIVKLEGEYLDHVRFLCIVSHNEEFFLLGVDEDNEDSRSQPTIGIFFNIDFKKKSSLFKFFVVFLRLSMQDDSWNESDVRR